MQKHLANIKTIIQREEQKANGAGRETKNKTMETKKASSYQHHQTMPHNQSPSKDKLPKGKMT